MSVPVSFLYIPGVRKSAFSDVTLTGSWDTVGRSSPTWTTIPMAAITVDDGSPGFAVAVDFDPSAVGTTLTWGVTVSGPDGNPVWGIPAGVADAGSQAQTCSFVLADDGSSQEQVYRLSWHRTRGAVAVPDPGGGDRRIQFSAWAPNASAVEVVFGGPSGYVADDGSGAAATPVPIPMNSDGTGMWQTEQPDFDTYVGLPYIYRVTRDDGSVNMGTDLWSKAQRCARPISRSS